MPTKESADKIEIELWSRFRKFRPSRAELDQQAEEKEKAKMSRMHLQTIQGQEGKIRAKSSSLTYQFQVHWGPDSLELKQTADPGLHWLTDFPPISITYFSSQYRRQTFMTTLANPYYDTFGRWETQALQVGQDQIRRTFHNIQPKMD
ncbi:hypothetical protein C8J56DRAFT_949029 [Mycena floridula]|nr:hypothetical protein C8J56DRAFT_949029 [Mycena floridula]